MTTVATMAMLMMASAAALQPAASWTVYLRRAGPLRIGMSLPEVRRILVDPQAFLAWVDKERDNSPCAYLQSAKVPKSLGFMFQSGRLVRIDVRGGDVRTASGAGVGDTEETVMRLYPGRMTVEPHRYLPENGHYLRYGPRDMADRDYGIVFETKDARVTSFRTGTRAAVALVEGCA